MAAVPHCQELLQALKVADASFQETESCAGPFLVQSLRGSTYHPLFMETFPEGLLMVSWKKDPEGYRVRLPTASGPCEEPAGFEQCKSAPKAALGSASKAAPFANTSGRRLEFIISEARLEPIDVRVGRQVISALSQHKVRLNLPLVVAVKEESSSEHGGNSQRASAVGNVVDVCNGSPACVTYLGVRTRPAVTDENEAPTSAGLHVIESIRVLRPWLAKGESLIIGDLLRHLRGGGAAPGGAFGRAPSVENGQQGVEVHIRLRYDHRLASEEKDDFESHLPAELLPGPFLSLVYSWPMSLHQAMSANLTDVASSAGTTVLVRGSYCAERSLLGQYLQDLDFLRFLAASTAGSAEVPLATNIASSEGAPSLSSEAEICAAVSRFMEDERRLATASAQDWEMCLNPSQTQYGAAEDAEKEARPSRDFVDRLWLTVFSRCPTLLTLTLAVRCVLQDLGELAAIAPCVRRENGCEMAELARAAVKMKTLQSYGTVSESQKLQEARATWEARCKHCTETEHAVPLVLGAGMECMRQDLFHMITRCGYITATDLSYFSDVSLSIHTQLERLQCLQRVAELAVLCTRHRLPLDTLRQLILKAVEYYQRDTNTRGDKVPVFSGTIRQTSGARFFHSEWSHGASSIVLQCGSASIRAEKTNQRCTAEEAGIWVPASESSFHYRVNLIDRYGYQK